MDEKMGLKNLIRLLMIEQSNSNYLERSEAVSKFCDLFEKSLNEKFLDNKLSCIDDICGICSNEIYEKVGRNIEELFRNIIKSEVYALLDSKIKDQNMIKRLFFNPKIELNDLLEENDKILALFYVKDKKSSASEILDMFNIDSFLKKYSIFKKNILFDFSDNKYSQRFNIGINEEEVSVSDVYNIAKNILTVPFLLEFLSINNTHLDRDKNSILENFRDILKINDEKLYSEIKDFAYFIMFGQDCVRYAEDFSIQEFFEKVSVLKKEAYESLEGHSEDFKRKTAGIYCSFLNESANILFKKNYDGFSYGSVVDYFSKILDLFDVNEQSKKDTMKDFKIRVCDDFVKFSFDSLYVSCYEKPFKKWEDDKKKIVSKFSEFIKIVDVLENKEKIEEKFYKLVKEYDDFRNNLPDSSVNPKYDVTKKFENNKNHNGHSNNLIHGRNGYQRKSFRRR
jgi:hypothetical protein